MLFGVLGPLDIRDATGAAVTIAADKQRRLLLALLVRANDWVSVEALTDAVWQGKPPASAAGNLKTYVSKLRKALPVPEDGVRRIENRRGSYRLRVAPHECDATVFERHVEQGRRLAEQGEYAAAARCLSAAVDMWRGRPYEPLTTDTAEVAAARLDGLRWEARDTLADSLIHSGRPGEAVTLLRAWTVEDRLREQTWERLMLALYATDRRSDALEAYQQARRALVDELGVEPGQRLRTIQRAVLNGDPYPAEAAESPGGATRTTEAGRTPQDASHGAPDQPGPQASAAHVSPPVAADVPGAAPPPQPVAVGSADVSGGALVEATLPAPRWQPAPEAPGGDDVLARDIAEKLADDHARHRRLAVVAASLIGAVLLTVGMANAPAAFRDNFPIPSFALPSPTASTPEPAVTNSAVRSPSPTPRKKKRPPKHHNSGGAKPKAPAAKPRPKAHDRPRTHRDNNSTPVLKFLAPAQGARVSGTVTIKVKVSNPSRLSQVDFHQLTLRCDDDGDRYKKYIGNDKTPDANGVYTFRFDTRKVDDGCLHFGAVGLDKHSDRLYPEEGVYRKVYVDN